MNALLAINDGPNYRRHQFAQGLKRCGYTVVDRLGKINCQDILVTWNRHGARNMEALRFEAAGARVVVTENGLLGKNWNGHKWFSLALGQHSGAGTWPSFGPQRWASWDVDMAPFKENGREVLVLGQRGIGAPGIASPYGWAERTAARIPQSRIRKHPGKDAPAVPLAEDLKDARCVVTWHSAAALQALMLGVPVFYDFPKWIGRTAGKSLAALLDGEEPLRDEAKRLQAMESIAWAMWTDIEIEDGSAFGTLLRP